MLDPQNAKDIQEVSDDKSIPPTWKAMFFQQLGSSIHKAMVEILRTKHENKIFDAVNSALDSHTKDTMIGACVWASQTAASAAGNLPGPNSFYVGVIRIKAVNGLKELGKRAPDAVLGDILPHWFEALKLSTAEQTDFTNALKEFNEKHTAAVTNPNDTAAQVAKLEAEKVYNEKLLDTVRNKGRPQAGWELSLAMTGINLICLIAVWKATPDQWSARNWADVITAGSNFGVGACATFVRWRTQVAWMKRIVEHAAVGVVVGTFTALVSFLEGLDTAMEAWEKHDYWLVGSGVAQMASGVCIAIGVFWGIPGFQMAGLVFGLAAGAIAIIDDAVTDKMKEFVNELIKAIKDAKSTWDNSPLTANLGLTDLINELEKLVESCQVTELAYNRNWTGPGGLVISHDVVHDRLNLLGIKDGLHRERLCRKVWAT